MYYSLEDRNVAEIGTGPTLFFPKFGLEPESMEELETNWFKKNRYSWTTM